jgi:hypothetical protein
MSYEIQEAVVRSEMQWVIKYMLDESNVNLFVFGNKKKDMEKRHKMAKAAKKIYNYYSMKEDRI